MVEETKDAKPVIGIDLGTTFTTMAVWDSQKGVATIIEDESGYRTSPSVVCFMNPRRAGHQAQVLIGSSAVN